MITLQRLRAENFKGLRSVDLSFPEQGSILIEGHNEAGKSTLFEAIYVALYGELLVGENSRPRLEEAIQHGQPQALVELTFTVGVQQLAVQRVLRRERAQYAQLTIRRPDGTEDIVHRPAAVNKRILQELNNLDGENLRNSCFVEQQELGRLEEMDSGKREQAIQKLLGLERLAKLSDQFKFKREQERELDHARRLLDLAHAQAAIRTAEAEEQALAERLDAARIAAYLVEYDDLEKAQANVEAQLGTCARQESDVRDRLARVEQAHKQLAACDETQQRLEKASAQRETVERLARRLADLEVVERETQPATRARHGQLVATLELVIDAEQKRQAVRNAESAAQNAERAVAELRRTNDAVRARAEALETAKGHAEQRHQETASARERNQRRLTDLAARHQRLNLAFERVTIWEQARERLEATQRDIRAAEGRVSTLEDLRAALRRHGEAARRATEASKQAERNRQETETRRREAEGRMALQEWIRLKEVEASLSGFVRERTRLEVVWRSATSARASAQGRARRPLYVAGVTTLLAVLAFAAGAIVSWALAVGGVLTVVAILLWVGYTRARADVRSSTAALIAAENHLNDLTRHYQAAVRAGGDPALLRQRERELAAAGFAAPPSLDAARAWLAALLKGANLDVQNARAVANEAVAIAARLAAEAGRTQTDVAQAQEAVRALEADGDAEAQLRTLRAREAVQRAEIEAAEEGARGEANADLQWPMSSEQIRVALANCSAEQRAVEGANAELEATAKRAGHDDADSIALAAQSLRAAEDAATALRATDPQATFAEAQVKLSLAEDVARNAEATAQSAAQDLGLIATRAVAEAERGRVEERLQTLEGQLAATPALTTELANARAALGRALEEAHRELLAIVEAVRPLVASVAVGAPTPNEIEPGEHPLTNALANVQVALEASLAALDESGAQDELEAIFHQQGTLTQRLQATQEQLVATKEAICGILTTRSLPQPTQYTSDELSAVWPLIGMIAAADKDRLQVDLEQARNRTFAAWDQERRLAEALEHLGTPLSIEECERRVRELAEERDICHRAARLIQETCERIARQVLPTTERNMQLLLPELTARRYWDVRLTPPDGDDGQPGQLDYRIRVWDQTAGRYVAKSLFSGGTRDQCSLALRLAFALATLPQELGVAPGFIFLDEPLSAFDAQRAQALVNLLTTGTIAQQFAQVVVISHHHAFDRRAFQYHVHMEGGQVAASDLPETHDHGSPPTPARLAAKAVLPA